jgi:trimeric autotransporter adhesin
MSLLNTPRRIGASDSTKHVPSYFVAMTVALLVAIISGACFAAQAKPNLVYVGLPSTPLRTYVTDGTVNAVVRSGETIYIGGQFSRVGPRTGPGVEVALDGSENAGLPEISGSGPSYSGGSITGLRAVISDGAGGWYISGVFSHVGGIARTNVAHILADHSVDPGFNPVLDGSVDALALSGTSLYMAGEFTLVDGTPRSNIAAYHTLYDFTLNFNPYADGPVRSLAVSADGLTVYAGGSFGTIGGQSRTSIAALDADSGAAIAAFNPVLTASGQPRVTSVAIAGSILYVGGTFTTTNSLPYAALVAVNLVDGSLVTAFNPAPTYAGHPEYVSIECVAVSGSVIYAGGSFDNVGGQSRTNLAAVNAADGTATDFDPSPQQNIDVLAVSGSTVYVSGGFTAIGGQPRNYIAGLNAADGSATAFDPNPNNSVFAIGVSDTAVYFGGLFSSLGGVSRSGLAAINAGDGTANAWDPNPQGPSGNSATIDALQLSGTTLYVGGGFAQLGGQARDNIGAVDSTTGIATSWNPSADGEVSAIALSGSLVYAGGYFLTIGGQSRVFVAALNASDGLATAWNPSPDNSVNTIVASGNLVYLGGFYDQIAGQARSALSAFNTTDGSITSWDPQLGPGPFGIYIYTLAVSGPTIYAGGGFTSVGGVARHNIAGINASDGNPTSFDPEASGANDDGAVWAIAVDGTTIYVGGEFDTIGGQPRNYLAAVDATTGNANDFNPNALGGNTVYALTFDSETLYVGGSFPTFALVSSEGFAAFSDDTIFHDGFEGQ